MAKVEKVDQRPAKIQAWIDQCAQDAPPVSQLHFSLYLATRIDELIEALNAP